MKKILIVNQHFLTGGIKKTLENLLPVLRERYDVKVLFLCGSTKEFEEKFPGCVLPTPFILSAIMSSLDEMKKMNPFLLPIRVGIKCMGLVLSKLCSAEKIINCAIKMSKSLGQYDCAIAYAHDNWFKNGSFFGGCNEMVRTKADSEKKISWLHGEPKTIGLTPERLARTYREFDQVVAVSKACQEQFEVLSGGKIKCENIQNLYDIEEIRAKTRDVVYQKNPDGMLRIVTVGRLSKIAKRIDKVNEIAKILKEKNYLFDWTVVGDGSEYESCVATCKAYALEDCVHYVGHKSNPYPYIKQSDVLVMVSDSEASPMVLNEALIVGTPVISTDFQAACETVHDGRNGLICNKDVQSICERIEYCIRNQEELQKFRTYISEHPINNERSIERLFRLIG